MSGNKIYRFGKSEYYFTQDVNGHKKYYNKDKKEISESVYLQNEGAYVNKKDGKVYKIQKRTVEGSTTGNYYTCINGQYAYYNKKGQLLKMRTFLNAENARFKGDKIVKNNADNQQKKSAAKIVENLVSAADGWNDIDNMMNELKKIDNPDELAEVNRLLATKGYKADDLYSPVEKFMYAELHHGSTRMYNSFKEVEDFVQKWIKNGTLEGENADAAQARLAARIICDGGDGFGTDTNKIKRGIHLIKASRPTGNDTADKASAKNVYNKVNTIIKNHKTFYGLGSKCDNLRDYLEGEEWESEVKELDAILAKNDALQGGEKAKAIRALVREAVEGMGTDEQALKTALQAITTKADRIAVNKELEAYIQEKGIKKLYPEQDPLQAIMYDELNHKEIRNLNEMLITQGAYKKNEADMLRAEQAALQAADGGYKDVLDAVQQIKDPEVLKQMNAILQRLKGDKFNDLDALMDKKNFNQTKKDLVNAELAANNLLSTEKAADVAVRLLVSDDFDTIAKGFCAIRNSKTLDLVNKALQKQGKSLAKILEKFNKDKDKNKKWAETWDFVAKMTGPLGIGSVAEHISDEYAKNTDVSDDLYLESDNVSTTVTAKQKAAYDAAIKKLETDYEQMKNAYEDEKLWNNGILSGLVNEIASVQNWGTTRDELEARLEHDKETIRLLKIAAEGKLTKMKDGKIVSVSFEEVFKIRQSAVVTGNASSVKKKEETNFDIEAVTAVDKQAAMIGAMDFAKDEVLDGWTELISADKSGDVATLESAIIGNLNKLQKITGKEMNLSAYNLAIKDNKIVDLNGKQPSVSTLKTVVAKLKTAYSDFTKFIYGKELNANMSADDVKDAINDGYDDKMNAFKDEYRKAFGQEPTDEMIESYISTINTGKTIVNAVALIAATIATAGYGAIAVFAATAVTSLTMNGVENATSGNGLSLANFENNASQAIWDGALSAVGIKIGQYAAKAGKVGSALFTKNKVALSKCPGMNSLSEETLDKIAFYTAKVEAHGGSISANTASVLAMEYCRNGELDEQAFVKALIMSAGFEIGGVVANRATKIGAKVVEKVKNTTAEAAGSRGTTMQAANKPAKPSGAKQKGVNTENKPPKASVEHYYEMEAVKTQKVSPEFTQAVNELKKGAVEGKTIGEMLDSNPLLSKFKDELNDLADYNITALNDNTLTIRGRFSGQEIQLNFKALEVNEDAFINTLLHEAEHAKQFKTYRQLKAKSHKSEGDKTYIQKYEAMVAADNARAEYYAQYKDVIDQFVHQTKNVTSLDKLKKWLNIGNRRQIIKEYKQLVNNYEKSELEMAARNAGRKAINKYNRNRGVESYEQTNTGNEGTQGTDGISEGNSTGHQERAMGSDAQHNVSEGTNGAGREAVASNEVVTPTHATSKTGATPVESNSPNSTTETTLAKQGGEETLVNNGNVSKVKLDNGSIVTTTKKPDFTSIVKEERPDGSIYTETYQKGIIKNRTHEYIDARGNKVKMSYDDATDLTRLTQKTIEHPNGEVTITSYDANIQGREISYCRINNNNKEMTMEFLDGSKIEVTSNGNVRTIGNALTPEKEALLPKEMQEAINNRFAARPKTTHTKLNDGTTVTTTKDAHTTVVKQERPDGSIYTETSRDGVIVNKTHEYTDPKGNRVKDFYEDSNDLTRLTQKINEHPNGEISITSYRDSNVPGRETSYCRMNNNKSEITVEFPDGSKIEITSNGRKFIGDALTPEKRALLPDEVNNAIDTKFVPSSKIGQKGVTKTIEGNGSKQSSAPKAEESNPAPKAEGTNATSNEGTAQGTGTMHDTMNYPDGSVETVVTHPNGQVSRSRTYTDGTVSTNTNYPDGSVEVVVTHPNGQVSTSKTYASGTVENSLKNTDGSFSTTKKYPDGSSEHVQMSADGKITTTTTNPDGTINSVTADSNGNIISETNTVLKTDKKGTQAYYDENSRLQKLIFNKRNKEEIVFELKADESGNKYFELTIKDKKSGGSSSGQKYRIKEELQGSYKMTSDTGEEIIGTVRKTKKGKYIFEIKKSNGKTISKYESTKPYNKKKILMTLAAFVVSGVGAGIYANSSDKSFDTSTASNTDNTDSTTPSQETEATSEEVAAEEASEAQDVEESDDSENTNESEGSEDVSDDSDETENIDDVDNEDNSSDDDEENSDDDSIDDSANNTGNSDVNSSGSGASSIKTPSSNSGDGEITNNNASVNEANSSNNGSVSIDNASQSVTTQNQIQANSQIENQTNIDQNMDIDDNEDDDNDEIDETQQSTILASTLVNGRDANGDKREITPQERMKITEHIQQAQTEADIALIQGELRSFKRFNGRKNLRRALKAKLRSIQNADMSNTSVNENEKYQRKYEKRMDKIEDSKVYQEDLEFIRNSYEA